MENQINWDEARKRAIEKFNDPHRVSRNVAHHTRGHLLCGILESTSNNELNKMYDTKKKFRRSLNRLIS